MTRPSSFRFKINVDLLAGATVAFAPLVYFLPAVKGALVISPDDGLIFNIPLRVAAANIVRAGHLPLWNPYIFCGMPLHGAAQAGMLFPPNWFYLFFSAPVATNVMMLTAYALAGLGAYLYARRSGANILGAVLTSVVWQWSAFMVCQIGHMNVVHTGASLPWILWAVDGYGVTRGRWRGLVLSSTVALQCFAGHQQTFAYSLLLVVAYALVMARASKETRDGYIRSVVFVAAGILLSAVQILPTLELLRNSPRAATSYDFFTSFSMPRRFILTLFAPFLSGGGDGRLFRAVYVGPTFFAEYVVYIGLTTLILAILAVILKPDLRTKFWAGTAFVCLVLALGRYAPLGLYKVIYFVPVLNLFRVPARHLMEVEFALAVLAGRGLTILAARRNEAQVVKRVAIVGVVVLLLTFLVVTWGRPAEFRLGRDSTAVSLLRAPELFLPVVFSALGAWAVWIFARGRSGAPFVLVAVIIVDLLTWGQSSGWRSSSAPFDFELWGEPETVRFLHERERQANGEAFRVLTQDQFFDPAQPLAPLPSGTRWLPALQPDVYMMYGIENAGGYDGFGLARQSRLAGDMKVWGELTDPERTLRSGSRELDLLNVRYLLTRPMPGPNVSSSSLASSGSSNAAITSQQTFPLPAPRDFPDAAQSFAGLRFAAEDLNLPSIGPGARLSFAVPPVEADHIALLTNLSWAVEVADGTTVARVTLQAENGKTFEFDLRAGQHTSDWAYDRADIRSRVRHARAPVATSNSIKDAKWRYEGHTYVSFFSLPERTTIARGEITVARVGSAPELMLSVSRISLLDQAAGKAFPLRREWTRREPAQHSAEQRSALPSRQPASASTPTPATSQSESSNESVVGTAEERWRYLDNLGKVVVYENTRALPRAWLASRAMVLGQDQILKVIRTGTLPDDTDWNPRQTALIEAPINFNEESAEETTASARVMKHEPNRVELKTASRASTILVLSENYFTGWRAFVDGRAVESLRVNYALRGLVLPAGDHRVEFVYRPMSVVIGFLISLLTLIALLLWEALAAPSSVLVREKRERLR